MFAEILLTAALGLMSISLFVVLQVAWENYQSFEEFKNKSKGIIMAPHFKLVDGHLSSYIFKRHIIMQIDSYMRENQTKTTGVMYGSKKCIVTTDLELIKQVHEKPLVNVNRIDLGVPIKEYGPANIIHSQNDTWRRTRRAIAPALRESEIKKPHVIEDIQRCVSRLIDYLESCFETKQEAMNIDFDELMNRFGLDTMQSCLFKQYHKVDYYAERVPLLELQKRAFRDAMSRIVLFGVASTTFRPILQWVAAKFHPLAMFNKHVMHFIKEHTKLHIEAREHLKQLRAEGRGVEDENNFELPDGRTFRRNLVDSITDHFCEGKITQDEYFHSTNFLMTAGYITLADTLAQTICLLGTHPEVQQKLRSAVISAGTSDKCDYLDWVIKEVLRLFPSVSISGSRTTETDINLDGGQVVIPAGTFIIMPSYVIHRMSEYWGPDAAEFKPERWATIDEQQLHPYQFMPFGAGVRICPGQFIAGAAMRIALTAMVARFSFQCEKLRQTFDAPFMICILWDEVLRVNVTRL